MDIILHIKYVKESWKIVLYVLFYLRLKINDWLGYDMT